MPRTREVEAAKEDRQRREKRLFGPSTLGALCAGGCGTRVPQRLVDAGILTHPTCHRADKDLP
jgi:hypothetical protein